MNECPRCKQRIMKALHSGDYVHTCNSQNPVLDTEDVIKSGNWEDFTGSGEVQNANLQGITNTANGTRQAILGVKDVYKTVHGNNLFTHRTRQHEEYIE